MVVELDLAAFEVPEVLQAVAAATGKDPYALLLTGGEDLFLERDIAGGSGDADGATRQAWWPADKVSAPRLAPYLYALEQSGAQQLSRLASS